MKQINMVTCIRCGEDYADECNDGICDNCIPQIEVDMAIADIWTAITRLTSRGQDSYISSMKDTLLRVSKQLQELVNKL